MFLDQTDFDLCFQICWHKFHALSLSQIRVLKPHILVYEFCFLLPKRKEEKKKRNLTKKKKEYLTTRNRIPNLMISCKGRFKSRRQFGVGSWNGNVDDDSAYFLLFAPLLSTCWLNSQNYLLMVSRWLPLSSLGRNICHIKLFGWKYNILQDKVIYGVIVCKMFPTLANRKIKWSGEHQYNKTLT